MRTPSYTDRILARFNSGDGTMKGADGQRNGNGMRILYYGRRESTFSDHRPVLCLYKFAVRKVNRE